MGNMDVVQMSGRIINGIDSGRNKYLFTEELNNDWKKDYKYTIESKRLKEFADDKFGMISDCFILYAVASLGVCDRRTIQQFLFNLKNTSDGLYIADPTDDAAYKNRIGALCKVGFLFKFSYHHSLDENGLGPENTLYTIEKEGTQFMNTKLERRVPYNSWIPAKPIYELLGWAATTNIGTQLAANKSFVSYEDGVFRNRRIGVYYFPFEAKFRVKDVPYYVAGIPAYLLRDTKTLTESAFNELKVLKVNVMRAYLTERTTKGPANIFITVMDIEDLKDMADLLVRTEVLLEHLDQIYFTGFGAFADEVGIDYPFLQMQMVQNEQGEVIPDFVAAVPDFIEL